jgi:hypothetical protein
MHDKGKIVTGIVIFLILVLFPVWFTLARGEFTRPDLGDVKKVTGADACVRDVEYMRAHHMDLLDSWRNEVVRNGPRIDAVSGEEMSLTRTCLGCHRGEGNKTNFCNRCHDYVGANPNCWDCHIDPEAP